MRRLVARLSRPDFLDRIELDQIKPSKFPLRSSPGDMTSLMSSISELGLLQPMLVRPVETGFEIVCGHRRYEASKRLKLKEVPCIVQYFTDQKAFEVGLTENVQRQSLDPIDEATAFRRYVREFGWGGISRLARRIGKSEEYVSQRILLLSLPKEIQAKVKENSISPSNARELVWLKNSELQKEFLKVITDRELPVKKVHEAIKFVKKGLDVHEALDIATGGNFFIPPYRSNKPDPSVVLIDRAIAILRVGMMRLDELFEDVKPKQISEFLIHKRFAIHQLIDECIRFKKEMQ